MEAIQMQIDLHMQAGRHLPFQNLFPNDTRWGNATVPHILHARRAGDGVLSPI
jgi:hypothetical protein